MMHQGKRDKASVEAARALRNWFVHHPTRTYVLPGWVLDESKGHAFSRDDLVRAISEMWASGELRQVFCVRRPHGEFLMRTFDRLEDIPETLRDGAFEQFTRDDAEVFPAFQRTASERAQPTEV